MKKLGLQYNSYNNIIISVMKKLIYYKYNQFKKYKDN